ncbi:MAG: tetraacyldisaccharide 4'-kinase [Pirellulaceae bacterium]
MFTETYFRELVSGERRGTLAFLLRTTLRILEVPYGVAVTCRNRRFDRGRRPIHRVDVPVISVGNITAGGTGKTPMVAWLARWYRQRGVRVTLISRGYRAKAGSQNDEALELERQLPDVPHLQNPDRVEAARTAIEELDCQLILLDDAFQHRRLHRDLDVVLIDSLEPFGYGHQLPRGLLREPLSGLARAHVIALSRSDLIDAEQRQRILAEARRYAPEAIFLEMAHRPDSLLAWPHHRWSIETLADQPSVAFCGIGNPEGFRRMLGHLRLNVVAFRVFPDHHRYQRDDLDDLTLWAAENGASTLLCTQKDLVKIQADRLGQCDLRAVSIGIEILAGRDSLEEVLKETTSYRER